MGRIEERNTEVEKKQSNRNFLLLKKTCNRDIRTIKDLKFMSIESQQRRGGAEKFLI